MLRTVLFLAGSGLAAPATPASIPERPFESPEWFIEEGAPFRALVLELHPLGTLIGRFGGGFEFLPAPHHALVGSPHVYFAVPRNHDSIEGFGGELGYRYYFGQAGANGLFFGPSVLVGSYRYVHTTDAVAAAQAAATPGCAACDMPDDTRYVSLGGAVDAGYQWLFGHFVIGAGVGVQYTYFTIQPRWETVTGKGPHDLLYGSGLRPRLLMTLGGAF